MTQTIRRGAVLLAAALLAALGAGCAAPEASLPDDPATMVYRECMAGMPDRWTAADAGAAMSNPGTKNTASFEAAAESERARRAQMECLRQAGAEKP